MSVRRWDTLLGGSDGAALERALKALYS